MGIDIKSQGSKIFLLTVTLILLSVILFRDSIFLFPSFIHAWTQSDRYALALGFLDNGFDFFHPRTFNLATVDGITRVDFPIHEYIVALIMKISGNHEPVVFRVYTLIYAVTGLIFLFRLCELFIHSFFRNLLIVLFLFLCPIFNYYADGFLPSITSLSNLFIGYFFFFRYKKVKSKRDFSLAVFFLTLGALSRLPFFIFLFSVFCLRVLEFFRTRKIERREIMAWGFSFSTFFGYQLYNSWLGNKYGTQFLVNILPPRSTDQLANWIGETWSNWGFEYFTVMHYAILGIMFMSFLILSRTEKNPNQKHDDLLRLLLISATGSVIYFFLMLQQFPDHDYYIIDSCYPVAVLALIYLSSRSIKNISLNYGLNILLGILLILSYTEGKSIHDKRYETGYWDRVEISRKNFSGTGKFLDSIGVSRNAKILVLDGYTTNVPLILLDRKGWTVNWTTKENIEAGLRNPYDLVAVQNCFVVSDVIKNDPEIVRHLKKISDNGLISFYEKDDNPARTIDQLLGIDSSALVMNLEKNDSVAVDANTEFIELWNDSAKKILSAIPTKIFVTGKILRDINAPQLTSSLVTGEINLYYFSFDLSDYTARSDNWQQLFFQFVLPAQTKPAGAAKLYFWNNRKDKFYFKDIRISVYR